MLSPLRLSAFERYMLADDRPEYPMTFFLRLHLEGVPDRVRLVQALWRVTGRHPLLSAVVREVDGVPCWVPAVVAPGLEWGTTPSGVAPRAPLDIRRESGLRVRVDASDERATLLLEFHHVACDGIAAMQVVEDLLTAYAGEQQVPRPSLRPVVPPLLRRRQRFATTWLDRLTAAGKFLIAARGLVEFVWNRPVPLATTGRHDPQRANREHDGVPASPASISHRLNVAQTRAFQQAARMEGGTVNDLLLTEWLGTLADWQMRHGGRGRDTIRLLMPVNMRRDADEALPAANAVAMVFLDRSVRRSGDGRRLGASLRFDTGWVKRLRLGTVFLDAIGLLGCVPGALGRLLSSGRCLATAVLSNLGPQLQDLPLVDDAGLVRAGDVLLSRVDFLPPVRPETRVAVGVVTYAGRLSLTMHYDSRVVNERAARSLFARLVARVRRQGADDRLAHSGARAFPVIHLMASGGRREEEEKRGCAAAVIGQGAEAAPPVHCDGEATLSGRDACAPMGGR